MIRLQRGFAFAALGVAGLMLAGCESETPLAPAEPPVVTISQPLEKDVTDYDQYTGRVEAAQMVEVRARVRGELIKIHFKDGALVKAGDPVARAIAVQGCASPAAGTLMIPQPAVALGIATVNALALGDRLFDIDPRIYDTQLAVAKAKEENAAASLRLATSEYDRTYELYQSGKAASAREVEVWAAKQSIALAEMNQAKADIERAKLDVEFTKIKAPITGRINRALVTTGNLVNAGGGDTLLTTIVSIDPIYVYFDVDERSLELYRKRRAKELGADAAAKPPVIPVFLGLVADEDRFPREGAIDFADNQINAATGTIRVRGVFPNKDGRLTPGMFARVRLPVGERYKGLLVTDQAVGIDQGQKYLLVVNKENKVEYRPVLPGRLDGDLRIFPPGTGLNPGEWVIVNGVQRVRPGVQVRPERVAMPVRPNELRSTKSDTRNKAK